MCLDQGLWYIPKTDSRLFQFPQYLPRFLAFQLSLEKGAASLIASFAKLTPSFAIRTWRLTKPGRIGSHRPQAAVFTVLGLIAYSFSLPCRFVPLSMNDSPPSMESGPQSWIHDYGKGDGVHECMQLSVDKSGIHGKSPSSMVRVKESFLDSFHHIFSDTAATSDWIRSPKIHRTGETFG